ncbi:MAG: COQ9 family protein [Tabrizicola sp.]|nr:COQ9 family protein [Tabrizicola sp.]
MTRTDTDPRARLLKAALPHVPFDGWSEVSLRAAAKDLGLSDGVARALFPRGGVDLALAYHAVGDEEMVDHLAATDLAALRFRDRIATAVMLRLALADRELVRRGTTLFAFPPNSAQGAAALWRTSDRIWGALGDESRDVNWYSKRASLSAVYGATVLFWLGDTSPEDAATRAFLDRRIDQVMGIEKLKARLRDSVLGKAFAASSGRVIDKLRASGAASDRTGKEG